MDFETKTLFKPFQSSSFAHWQPQVLNSQNIKHKLLYYLKHNDNPGYSISFPGSKTSDQLFSTANENANTFNKFHSNLAFLTFSDNNNLCIANVEMVARLPTGLYVAIISVSYQRIHPTADRVFAISISNVFSRFRCHFLEYPSLISIYNL